MTTPPDPKALKALENEARRCEATDDYLGALDAYEEIQQKGWATAIHIVAMGECYLKNRQRQNAMDLWLKALEEMTDEAPVRQALDRYFPDWERKAALLRKKPARPAPPRPAERDLPPPPPPPPAFGGDADTPLSVETTRVRQPERAPLRATPPPEAELPAEQTHSLRPGRGGTLSPTPAPAPAAQAGPVQHATAAVNPEYNVNWDFVLQDAAEEMGVKI
ncbi:MAG TPA: hypothetical protein PLS90_11765 [Candidatus Sumerlaeota bacterium]|nr:MAG: hypothetical protein BWZ08_01391 [candidate division BRC1 bacterium ADurb.BinA292]HOE95058.1 hypothetical protein [Candidatus Sumerlaeota bacterium]HOR26675.1 hypothetical protein [Candidatus Sumerlaeota bacterium]HPK03125.1 hypothetical protein [Candidatus Sumerlaeota bacterium]